MGLPVCSQGIEKMLAAASAWRVFGAEHARLRQLSDAIDRAVAAGEWQHQGAQLTRLRQLIVEFQDFETGTHRPKGIVLMDSMRGRLAPVDELLVQFEEDGRRCDQLLAQALALLEKVEHGQTVDAAELASMLQQHRSLITSQLDREDTVFRAYTAELLTSDEWSAVVSSISNVVQKVKARRLS